MKRRVNIKDIIDCFKIENFRLFFKGWFFLFLIIFGEVGSFGFNIGVVYINI